MVSTLKIQTITVMYQLFINHEPTQLFINETFCEENYEGFYTGFDKKRLKNWIGENLDKFNLNEPHSCEVSDSYLCCDLCITGDEDHLIIDVKELHPIF